MGNQEVLVFTGGPPPNWLEKHAWFAPVTVVPADKMPMVGLKKIELKVEMCCMKCAEIVSEEIREVPGVMDVKIDYVIKKVTVIGKPYGPDVLRRARRVDKKADYWPPPPPPPPTPPPPPPAAPDPPSCTACQCAVCKPPPPKEEPKKEEEKKEEKKEEEKKEEKKEEEKKEEPKKEEEKKEEEKKEEPKKEEEKKEEEKKEEPKKEEEKKEEPKKEETPGVQAVQYPPYEYLVGRFPGYDYHPSQSYNPLLPHHPFPYSRQVYFDWPHFRTTEAGAEAAFLPPSKPSAYQTVGDFWNIFQPP